MSLVVVVVFVLWIENDCKRDCVLYSFQEYFICFYLFADFYFPLSISNVSMFFDFNCCVCLFGLNWKMFSALSVHSCGMEIHLPLQSNVFAWSDSEWVTATIHVFMFSFIYFCSLLLESPQFISISALEIHTGTGYSRGVVFLIHWPGSIILLNLRTIEIVPIAIELAKIDTEFIDYFENKNKRKIRQYTSYCCIFRQNCTKINIR